MNRALVHDAEHDVDGHQGGEQQPCFVLQRILELLRGTLERRRQRGGLSRRGLYGLDRSHCLAKRVTASEVERESDRWKETLMVDDERRHSADDAGDHGERNELTRIRRADVEMVQRIRGELVARVDAFDNLVLVRLREQGRDLALSECIVEDVIDSLRREAQ